jgi:hypothetical protein
MASLPLGEVARAVAERLVVDRSCRPAAAESVGIRVLLVHAIDDNARRFYERHGFQASPTDPRNLQMLMKDILASAETAGT